MNIFIKIILYFLSKYIVFYSLYALLNKNYSVFKLTEIKTLDSLIYYLFLFLTLPLSCIIIFTFFIYLSVEMKKTLYLLIFLLGEYILYSYLTSTKIIDFNGLLNLFISIVFLFIFFKKQIIESIINFRL